MDTTQIILDSITWSYSSVNSYTTCPKMFKLTYIDGKSKINNAFAQWGSFMHSILEKYFSGELEMFQLSDLYKDQYQKNVTLEFPENAYVDLGSRYYDTGLKYLNNFEGFDRRYNVVDVEQKIDMSISERPFVGFIDLVLTDQADGAYIIVDHKSKSNFKNNLELTHYLRQLYLYASYIKHQYGEYPKQLWFNMIRADQIIRMDFDRAAFDEAKRWFSGTIEQIYADRIFTDKIAMRQSKTKKAFKNDDFFCNNLCGVREHCLRSTQFLK